MGRRKMITKLDKEGRIVIPKQFRKEMGIEHNDEFYAEKIDAKTIVFRKYQQEDEVVGDLMSLLGDIKRDSSLLRDNPELADNLKSALLDAVCEINAIEIIEEP